MNIDRLEHLLETKTWSELTAEEKSFVVEELGSEEQFNAMRKVGHALVSMHKADLSPDPSIERVLKNKLKEKHTHSFSWQSVVQLKMPALTSALLIVLTAIVSWYAGKGFTVNMPENTQRIVHVTDTVYLSTAPDTIIVEKVRYRYIKKGTDPQNVFSVVNQTKQADPENAKGFNMKEKEELDNFLVSGSE
jgi:hypothetical protein